MKKLLSLALFVLVSVPAKARIFDFKEQRFAALVDGSFASTVMGQDAFAANLGPNVTMNEKLQYLYSGRLGFSFILSERLNFALAVEMLDPASIKAASGKNSSGSELYLFSASGQVLNPLAFIEYTYSRVGNVKYFFGLGAGWAQLTLDNRFEINAAGETHLGGVQSYTEKLEASSVINGYASLGLEAHFVDTATLVFQAGHRLFKVYELKHGSAVTTYAEGAVAAGDTVYNADGSKRQIDLSGPFVSLGVRFYIP